SESKVERSTCCGCARSCKPTVTRMSTRATAAKSATRPRVIRNFGMGEASVYACGRSTYPRAYPNWSAESAGFATCAGSSGEEPPDRAALCGAPPHCHIATSPNAGVRYPCARQCVEIKHYCTRYDRRYVQFQPIGPSGGAGWRAPGLSYRASWRLGGRLADRPGAMLRRASWLAVVAIMQARPARQQDAQPDALAHQRDQHDAVDHARDEVTVGQGDRQAERQGDGERAAQSGEHDQWAPGSRHRDGASARRARSALAIPVGDGVVGEQRAIDDDSAP